MAENYDKPKVLDNSKSVESSSSSGAIKDALSPVIEAATKKVADLGDEVRKTNEDLKGLNKQLSNKGRGNRVLKLLEEIDKLAIVLKGLKDIEVPVDKVNEIQDSLNKLAKVKFDATEITKITNVLAGFNEELSKLAGNVKIINNLDTKKFNAVADKVNKDKFISKEQYIKLKSEKKSGIIKQENHRKLLAYENIKPLVDKLHSTESQSEKDAIEKAIEKAWDEINTTALDYEKNRLTDHSKLVADTRKAGNKLSSTEATEAEKEEAQAKLDEIYKDYVGFINRIREAFMSVEDFSDYMKLQVIIGKRTAEEQQDLVKKYREHKKKLDEESDASSRLANFKSKYSKELEKANADLNIFKDYTNLRYQAGEIDKYEKDNLISNHRDTLKRYGSIGKSGTSQTKSKEDLQKELEELRAITDKSSKQKKEIRKLRVLVGEITEAEAEREAEAEKKSKKDLEYEQELINLYAIDSDKRTETQNKRIDTLNILLKNKTAYEIEEESYLKQQQELYEELLELQKVQDKSSGQLKRIRDIKVKIGRMSEADAEREAKYLREQQLADEKAAKNPLLEARRKVIEQRGEDSRQFGVYLSEKRLESERKNRKTNAGARLVDKLTGKYGVDTNLLSDFGELTGIISKDTDNIKALKLANDNIEKDRSDKVGRINQSESTQSQLIINENISQEEKIKKLDELSAKSHEEREKINKEAADKIIANEDAIASTTNKLGSTLTKAAIAIKVLEKTVVGLIKSVDMAAKSQAELVSNLQSMGASSDSLNLDSITWYTNELKQIEARWKNIKNDVGDMFTESVSGILIVFEGILNGLDSVSNWLEKTFGWKSNNSADLEKDEKKNQSAAKMLKIVESLEKGVITKNGLKVVVDRETSSKALNSIFSSANSLGIDNTSAGNLTSKISDMALDIYSKHGGDYGVIMQQLQDAIFNGSNSAAQYGINVDDQVLTGWAANTKGLDLANVEYTEAYKAALRFQLAQDELTSGNSDAMTKQIKRWKQLGDVIQTASGTLFDFQEVQTLQAKDFTIPEINDSGSIRDDKSFKAETDEIKELNEQVSETKQLYVLTADGIKTFEDALKYVNYDLDKIVLLYDEANNKMYLASSDYLPSLTDAEKNHIKELDSGVSAIATYARHLGLADQEMINLARNAGLSETQVGALKVSLDKLTKDGYTLNFDYSDITEAKKEEEELNKLLANKGYTNSGNVDTSKPNSYASELSKYSERIQKYVNNGYKFDDGTTIDDLDGDGNTSILDVGDMVEYWTNKEKQEIMMDFSDVHATSGKPIGYKPKAGMANGGISTKAHVTNISEGNAHEAVIPLDSSIGINALSSAMQIALGGVGGGINIENLNINNDGINIAENENQWRQVGNRIYEEISTIQRERGDMNYGIK